MPQITTNQLVNGLPSAISKVSPVKAPIFFVDLSHPITFTDTVNAESKNLTLMTNSVSANTSCTSYKGNGNVAGSFVRNATPVEIVTNADASKWYAQFDLASDRTAKDVVDSVISNYYPKTAQDRFAAELRIIKEFVGLYNTGTVIIGNCRGTHPTLGTFIDGFNVYSYRKVSEIPVLSTLHSAFPSLGLASMNAVLSLGTSNKIMNMGNISNAGMPEFYVRAGVIVNKDIIPGFMSLQSISTAVKTVGASVRLAAEGNFSMTLGASKLTVHGEVNVSPKRLIASYDGTWNDAFGCKGLSLSDVGVEAGFEAASPEKQAKYPEGTMTSFGFRGNVAFGTNALPDAKLAVFVDYLDPKKCVVQVISKQGLVAGQMLYSLTGLDVRKVLPVSITDINVYYSPTGGNIAGQTYNVGLDLNGRINILGFPITLKGGFSFPKGGEFKGQFGPFDIAHGDVKFVSFTGTNGSGPAEVKLSIDSTLAKLSIAGKISLLNGLFTCTTTGSAERDFKKSAANLCESIAFKLSTSAVGLGAEATFTMKENGGYNLTYGGSFTESIDLGAFDASVAVGAAVTTTGSFQLISKSARSTDGSTMLTAGAVSASKVSTFSQSVTFTCSALGLPSFKVTSPQIEQPILSAADLVKVFRNPSVLNQVITQLKNLVLGNYTAVANFLKNGLGFAMDEVADALSYLGVDASGVTNVLKNSFGWAADEVGEFLRDGLDLGSTAISGLLTGVSFLSNTVSGAITDLFTSITGGGDGGDNYFFTQQLGYNGKMGNETDNGNWGSYWEVAVPYISTSGRTFLIQHHTGGAIDIDEMGKDGSDGATTYSKKWKNFYDTLIPFRANNQDYLFCYSATTGRWFTEKLSADGKLAGAETASGYVGKNCKKMLLVPFRGWSGSSSWFVLTQWGNELRPYILESNRFEQWGSTYTCANDLRAIVAIDGTYAYAFFHKKGSGSKHPWEIRRVYHCVYNPPAWSAMPWVQNYSSTSVAVDSVTASGTFANYYGALFSYRAGLKNFVYMQRASDNRWYIWHLTDSGTRGAETTGTWRWYYGTVTGYQVGQRRYMFAQSD
jgi:hypothetical protein